LPGFEDLPRNFIMAICTNKANRIDSQSRLQIRFEETNLSASIQVPSESGLARTTIMTTIEETITTTDGIRLYVKRRVIENARGEVVIAHGFGEHSGRYGPLADYLNRELYSVTAYDHRGHGLSDGLPGHVENFKEYEDDLDKLIASVRERADARPIFLIGHSMGGLVALRYLAKQGSGLAGAIISAPLIAMAVPVSAHKLMIARVSARMAPRMRLDNEINPASLSRDPAVGKAYATDPLVNRKVSARWFAEATRAMDEVKTWAAQIACPLLVLHGTDDKLASCDATKELFARLGSTDKELGIYSGYYHELFNEPEKHELFERVTRWINKRVR
jgi:alpha-beta hydrolase superfamily lysophospholipase